MSKGLSGLIRQQNIKDGSTVCTAMNNGKPCKEIACKNVCLKDTISFQSVLVKRGNINLNFGLSE